jgi:hypothetical protein
MVGDFNLPSINREQHMATGLKQAVHMHVKKPIWNSCHISNPGERQHIGLGLDKHSARSTGFAGFGQSRDQ